MTEQFIKSLGYRLLKEYSHDQFFTRRYGKGAIEAEFTYEGEQLVTFDITIEEINSLHVDKQQLVNLTTILGSINH